MRTQREIERDSLQKHIGSAFLVAMHLFGVEHPICTQLREAHEMTAEAFDE